MLVGGSTTMVTVGLLVRLVAKPGKEAEVTSCRTPVCPRAPGSPS
jgi:hypothetical protein